MGHVDVARRAAQLFDEVIVAVYEGQEKPGALFTTDERIAWRGFCWPHRKQIFALTAFLA